jgi:hypothetical protein
VVVLLLIVAITVMMTVVIIVLVIVAVVVVAMINSVVIAMIVVGVFKMKGVSHAGSVNDNVFTCFLAPRALDFLAGLAGVFVLPTEGCNLHFVLACEKIVRWFRSIFEGGRAVRAVVLRWHYSGVTVVLQ